MGRGPPDFSSLKYWANRFENETEFEWLARSEVVLPLISRQAVSLAPSPERDLETAPSIGPLRILHFGRGSSNLGSEIQKTLDSDGVPAHVIDADYVPPTSLSARDVPVIQLDVLNHTSLKAATQEQGGVWDILVDKSTADAISCGPGIPISQPDSIDPGSSGASSSASSGNNGDASSPTLLCPPIEVLCSNLARVTRPGGKWISISYSSTRFDHLSDSPHTPLHSLDHPTSSGTNPCESAVPTWRVLEKISLGSTSLPEGRTVTDGKGGTRVVYEPETPTWAYILERV